MAEFKIGLLVDTVKAATGIKDLADQIDNAGSEAEQKLGGGFKKAGIAIAAVSVAMVSFKKVLDAAVERVIELDRAKVFNVMAKDVKGVTEAFGGVISMMEGTREATSIATAGFEGMQKKVAETANAIGFLTNVSNEAALEQVKSGQISIEFLNLIGHTQQTIENAIKKASSELGRELTEIERRRVVFKNISKDLGKVSHLAGALAKATPFAKLTANIKSAGEAIFNSLAPAYVKLSEALNKSLPDIIGFVESSIRSLKGLAQGAAESWEFVGKKIKMVTDQIPTWVKALAAAGTAVATAPIRGIIGLVKMAGRGAKEIQTLTGNTAKAMSKTAGAGVKTLADKMRDELKRLQKARLGKRLGATIVSEQLDEIKGFQTEARTLLRNYTASFLDSISALGGPIAGVFSALKDAPERFKIFAALFGKKTLTNLLKSTKQQREEMFKAHKQGDKLRKVFTLLQSRIKAGVHDLNEFVNNEVAVNAQLKAGNSLFASQAKLASVIVEQLNQKKDVTVAIFGLIKVIAQLEKEGGFVNLKVAKSLRLQLDRYKAIGIERARSLQITKMTAIAELQIEKTTQRREAKDRQREILRGVLDLVNQIQVTQGRMMPQEKARLDMLQRVRDVQIVIRDLVSKKMQIENRIAIGLDEASQRAAASNVISLMKQIDLLNLKKEKIQQVHEADLKGMTVADAFWRAKNESAGKIAQDTGRQLYSSFQTALGGIGNIISSTMEMVVSGAGDAGANAGKLFLDVLAGMATQMGSFFIAAGAAQQFVPPYTGAGAIAGGVALLALAGTLKGLGSLVGGGGASAPSVSSGGASAPSMPPLQLPGSKSPDGRAPVNFFFASAPLPWQKDSQNEQAQARAMQSWGRRMSNEGVSPFEIPKRFGARSFG